MIPGWMIAVSAANITHLLEHEVDLGYIQVGMGQEYGKANGRYTHLMALVFFAD